MIGPDKYYSKTAACIMQAAVLLMNMKLGGIFNYLIHPFLSVCSKELLLQEL